MEILFLLVGLAFVALGTLIVVSEARTRRGAWEVPGQVIGFSTGSSSDARYLHTIAAYVGPDGHSRYVESSVGSSSPLDAIGDSVTVLVKPDDPAQATIKSSLSYVLAGVVAMMGLISCIVFFAVFRIDGFSIVGAAVVVAAGSWKLRGALRDKPMTLQAWRDYKSKLFGPRTFTEDNKHDIRWVDPSALRQALENQRKASRVAIPVLLLAGAGLLLLGNHLHTRTEAFLGAAVPGAGVVVGLEDNDSGDTTTYAPVVEFDHDGRTYRFKDSIGSNPPSYRRGEGVAVLYVPSDPTNARIDRGRWNRAVPIFVGGFGVLLCSLGIWMVLKRPRETIPIEIAARHLD